MVWWKPWEKNKAYSEETQAWQVNFTKDIERILEEIVVLLNKDYGVYQFSLHQGDAGIPNPKKMRGNSAKWTVKSNKEKFHIYWFRIYTEPYVFYNDKEENSQWIVQFDSNSTKFKNIIVSSEKNYTKKDIENTKNAILAIASKDLKSLEDRR
ncbi:hypothetical protein CL617_00715 [archaeon]|nr:hypothetical protein [archaeon]|tara:strand:- start:1906 stop:2364 length:459 start_codon:yes stop_codon:yes gene_type:complete